MLLFVAIVLDARYKLKYVKFLFKKFYNPMEGLERSTKVIDTLNLLYSHYTNSLIRPYNETMEFQASVMCQSTAMQDCDVQSQWEKFLEKEKDVDNKSDLDKDLLDDFQKNKNFNILTWWKALSERYPIVSKIARDVLAIPVSTVASESALARVVEFLIVIEVLYHQRQLKLLFVVNNGYDQLLKSANLKIF